MKPKLKHILTALFIGVLLNANAQNWHLTGNSDTQPKNNFLGTTDHQPLIVRTNNLERMRIKANGRVGIGTTAPVLELDVNGSINIAEDSGLYIGNKRILHTKSSNNFFAGELAGNSFIAGYSNTICGYLSFWSAKSSSDNTAFGSYIFPNLLSGNQNTAIGTGALNSHHSGSFNTAIGYSSGLLDTSGENNTFLGTYTYAGYNYTNSTAIGYMASAPSSNAVRIGNSSVTSIGGYEDWTNVSDARIKKNIKDNVPGLSFINKLKPVTYNLDLDAADEILQLPIRKNMDGKILQPAQGEAIARKAKEQIVYTGFVAQDVEKAAKELNYDFSGVDAAKNEKDLYGLRYAEFVVPLVKAVQELSQQNDELKKEIAELKTLILKNNQPVASVR